MQLLKQLFTNLLPRLNIIPKSLKTAQTTILPKFNKTFNVMFQSVYVCWEEYD